MCRGCLPCWYLVVFLLRKACLHVVPDLLALVLGDAVDEVIDRGKRVVVALGDAGVDRRGGQVGHESAGDDDHRRSR